MEHQKLFYDQTRRDLEELNRRIDYCIKNGVELVVFVPTCPADTHSLTSKNEVEFTKRAIVGRAVSWTCLNTTDGLAPLLKKLAEIPELKVRTVYATGDMEYLSGNSRGMNYEDFMAALNENHQQIAQLVTLRLGGRLDQVLCEETDELLSARIAVGLIEGKVNIDVDGIVNLAQRNQVDWQELKSELTPIIDDFFYDQSNNIEIEKTITARSQYYRMRISLAEGINEEMVDELITDERLKQELKIDLVDYCAFHTLAQKLWGRDRMFILAGDSHPLESLAAKISGNFLISVEGNYKGSKFLEVPQLNTAIV